MPRNSKLASRDRGPASSETTQTDFAAMDVLGGQANPSTSVDICITDGFQLNSGLRIGEGDGVILMQSEAFVWRPWMAAEGSSSSSTGEMTHGTGMRKVGKTDSERTGGVVNNIGQFEISPDAWGLFKALWPKPDLLIIGTGPTIRPLAPKTKEYLLTLGMRLEVLDTRNAAAQYNMMAVERGVTEIAAALVPIGFGERYVLEEVRPKKSR
jgi:NADH dehydrogenase [ubiquinone] 1 alpha subcomplex assembly factor 3